MRFLFLFLALLSLTLSAWADTPAARFAVTDLGVFSVHSPHAGGAMALNDWGLVVGGFGHAFLWDGDKASDLGSLPPDGAEDRAESIAYGINNHGQIVGSSGSFGPLFMSGLQFARGILYENNQLHQLTQRNASFEPYAINDKGQIAGLNGYRGFFYENGRLTQIGTLSSVPVGNRSTARALNSKGEAVGWSTVNNRLCVVTGALPTHAFLWHRGVRAGRMRDLGTLPGWVDSYAYGINDRGEVIGSVSDTASGTYGVSPNAHAQAFLWRGGKMSGLGTLPGNRNSEAFGINNVGTVVGQSDGKAFLWRGGTMVDLNALLPAGSGWVLSEARAINAKGQIAGNGTLHGRPHAFLLTPG